jgi:hypothetical protein
MSVDIKEAFTELCRQMAEETDIKKLEILKQRMRLLVEKEGTGERETRTGRRSDGRSQ